MDRDAIGEAEEEHLRNRRRHPPRGLCAADQRQEMVEQRPRHMVEHPARALGIVARVAQQETRHRVVGKVDVDERRSEEHTSELQSLMRISYAGFFLKKQTTTTIKIPSLHQTSRV